MKAQDLREIECTLDNCFEGLFSEIKDGLTAREKLALRDSFHFVIVTIQETIDAIETVEKETAQAENRKRRERVNSFRELYYSIGRDFMKHGIKLAELQAMNATFDALMGPIEAGAERGHF